MRTDTLFGKNVNVVGNVSADLVLESLGKIYIKSRNKALTLDEVISSLMSGSGESIADKTIVIDGMDALDEMIIKDGSFVYDKSSSILYLLIDGELVELISVSTSDTRYVKKSGDTMTGSLTIQTLAGIPPLRVNSAMLNKKFNAEYLNGLPSSAYAQKNKDEDIRGSWQFNNSQYFNHPVYYRSNTLHYKDSLHTGSVGTPDFASGFGGYGWRIDGQTNTLTIDYVVVRKAMYVYELVVNKISATNGSLWVTNASKVEYAYQLKCLHADSRIIWNSISPTATNVANTDIRSVIYGLENNEGLIVYHNAYIPEENWTADQMASNQGDGNAKSTYKFKGLKVFVCKDKDKVSPFLLSIASKGSSFTFSEEDFPSSVSLDSDNIYGIYDYYDLFDPYFDTLVIMPVAVIKEGVNWYSNSAGRTRENVYDIKYVKTYPKYFAQGLQAGDYPILLTNLFLVKFNTDNLPVFKPGDLLRCQKSTGQGIKYYDAVVCNKLGDSTFIILLAPDIMDKTTTITYDSNLNPTTTIEKSDNNRDFYDTTGYRSNNIQGIVLEGDSLVLIGHLWDITRQNAVYITSSDDGSPYIDTMSEVNRPDYSVIYYTPTFETINLYKGQALPFTGKYYILKETSEGIASGQYAIAYKVDNEGVTHCFSIELNKIPTRIIIWYKNGENLYRVNFNDLYDPSQFTEEERNAILDNPVRIQEEEIPGGTVGNSTASYASLALVKALIKDTLTEETLENNNNLEDFTILVLRGYPNEHTALVTAYACFDLLLEDGNNLTTEDKTNFILENEISNDTIVPTRTTKARFGRLDGIIDDRFDATKLPHGFGLYGENVFLTGEFVLSNGKNVADFERDYLMLSSGLELTSKTFQSLRLDLINLANNTPNYGNLESAGIFLKDNKLIIFGDSILIITREDEFNGEAPTALFLDGKIRAKYLSIDELHSNVTIYPDNLSIESLNLQVRFTYLHDDNNGLQTEDLYFYSDNLVYSYRKVYPVATPVYDQDHHFSHYKYNYLESDTVTYIRRFQAISEKYSGLKFYLWSEVASIKGDLYVNSSTGKKYFQYVEYKDFFDGTQGYIGEKPGWGTLGPAVIEAAYKQQREYLAAELRGDEELPPKPMYDTYVEFCDVIASKTVRLWSLEYNGRGNLGGNSLYWDTHGRVNVNGVIIADEGRIGGFSVNSYLLYSLKQLTLHKLNLDGTPIRDNENQLISEIIKKPAIVLTSSYSDPSISLLDWRTHNVTVDENGENVSITKSYLYNQAAITPERILLLDAEYSVEAKNYVILSKDGISWRQNNIDLGASAILFNFIFIPTYSSDGIFCALIRYTGAGYNSSYMYNGVYAAMFSRVDFYYNKEGKGYISFPYLNKTSPDEDNNWSQTNADNAKAVSLWIGRNIRNGKISILVTGLNPGKRGAYEYLNSNNNLYYLDKLNKNEAFPSFETNDLKIKASITSINFCTGTGDDVGDLGANGTYCMADDTSWYAKILYGKVVSISRVTVNGDESNGSIASAWEPGTEPMVQSYTRNFIAFTTSDDDSVNLGGIMLLIVYNNYDLIDWKETVTILESSAQDTTPQGPTAVELAEKGRLELLITSLLGIMSRYDNISNNNTLPHIDIWDFYNKPWNSFNDSLSKFERDMSKENINYLDADLQNNATNAEKYGNYLSRLIDLGDLTELHETSHSDCEDQLHNYQNTISEEGLSGLDNYVRIVQESLILYRNAINESKIDRARSFDVDEDIPNFETTYSNYETNTLNKLDLVQNKLIDLQLQITIATPSNESDNQGLTDGD